MAVRDDLPGTLMGGLPVRFPISTRWNIDGRLTVVLALLVFYAVFAVPGAGAPLETAGWVGSNYTPAYACNQVQFWHDFRPEVVERELAAAKKYFGITSLRVYLHNINFDEESETFLANLEAFLVICQRHEIRPGFVFFDDCHRHEDILLDKPNEPVKGWHNGRWAACPQDRDRDPDNIEKFRPYVQEVIRPHRDDRRVLWWEIFNEPRRKEGGYSQRLRHAAYGWAKEVEPIQPVISCWDDNEATDIVDAHNYRADFAGWDRQADLKPDKGCVFTEAGARWYAPRPSNGEPCEVVHWLNSRKATEKCAPGVYLCWELMVGNSNCRWYWGTPEGTPEPTVPWCGLMWPDCTPVSLAEAEAIRSYVTGQTQALFFDDFQDSPLPKRPGWKTYGTASAGGSGVLKLSPGIKMTSGDSNWTDYVLEGAVMIQEGNGNAGLVFRVNDPRPGSDKFRGYYVGFDTEKLYLGKMNYGWQTLAAHDLSHLDCKVVPGVWNQIRVAAEGNRIRVWFNRMHPTADPDHGLRIDCTDKQDPIPAGAIGVRTHRVSAWFDNVITLPIERLPQP